MPSILAPGKTATASSTFNVPAGSRLKLFLYCDTGQTWVDVKHDTVFLIEEQTPTGYQQLLVEEGGKTVSAALTPKKRSKLLGPGDYRVQRPLLVNIPSAGGNIPAGHNGIGVATS